MYSSMPSYQLNRAPNAPSVLPVPESPTPRPRRRRRQPAVRQAGEQLRRTSRIMGRRPSMSPRTISLQSEAESENDWQDATHEHPQPMPGSFDRIPTNITDTAADGNPSPEATPKASQQRSSISPDAITIEDLAIDSTIRRRLEAPLTPKQAAAKQPGYLYVFQDVTRPHLLKVGISKEVYKRARQITLECGLDLIVRHRGPQIRAERRAENLVHNELKSFARPHKCRYCDKCHREWFEAPSEHVLKVVRKWTKFMLGRPYDADGQLNQFWQDRIWNADRYLTSEEADSPPKGHEALNRLWAKFVDAQYLAETQYRWRCFKRDYIEFDYWRNWLLYLFVLSACFVVVEFRYGVQMSLGHFLVSVFNLTPTLFIAPRKKADSTEKKSPPRRRSMPNRVSEGT